MKSDDYSGTATLRRVWGGPKKSVSQLRRGQSHGPGTSLSYPCCVSNQKLPIFWSVSVGGSPRGVCREDKHHTYARTLFFSVLSNIRLASRLSTSGSHFHRPRTTWNRRRQRRRKAFRPGRPPARSRSSTLKPPGGYRWSVDGTNQPATY